MISRRGFKAAAMGRFGSGWAWLSVNEEGNLIVASTANQDNPAMNGQIPAVGLDVMGARLLV